MLTTTRQMSVPFFNYPHVFKQHEGAILDIITNVGQRGAFILQQDMRAFEQNLKSFCGSKFALGVANGTDALWLALMAAKIGRGDEVIFCSHTYVATAASIHFVGATPIPVECGSDHMIDPQAVAAAVTSRTRAIMPTQVNGRTCDMDALQAIAKKHNLLIIEDAAQGLGSKYKGRCAGTFGIAGTISFYPAKTLGSFGDAGAVITSDDKLHDAVYALRDHGRDQDGQLICWGFNSRLDNLQAAILDLKLKYYEAEIARRREIASQYQTLLGDMEELTLPPAPGAEPDHFDVFQNYEIEANRRNELQAYLKQKGVGTLVQWGGKVVHQFEALKLSAQLPFTERMISRSLMLPMNTSLTDEDVSYVAEMIREFFATN